MLGVATGLPPRDLLAAAHRIEAAFGRVRAERFGPRTLDIDIISYADEVSSDPVLTLPHPRAHERAFVLRRGRTSSPTPSCPGGGRLISCLTAWTPPASGAPDVVLPGWDAMRPTRTSTLRSWPWSARWSAWLLLRSVYKHLPPLPWTGVPALLVAAAAEAWMGRDLRARIAGRRGAKPAAPLFVSRMVALAKASSLAAAVIAGIAAGFVIYLSGSLNAAIPGQDAMTAAVTFAAAVMLACAALYLEYCCRVPNHPDRDDQRRPGLREVVLRP